MARAWRAIFSGDRSFCALFEILDHRCGGRETVHREPFVYVRLFHFADSPVDNMILRVFGACKYLSCLMRVSETSPKTAVVKTN